MRTHSYRFRGILLFLVILLSFLPKSNVKAADIVTTDTWWSGLVELTEDVRVTSGATLTIQSGTTVRVISEDSGASGTDPDLVELIIEDGYLAVDSATFEAAAGQKWFGIHILEDGVADISNSEIKDSAVYGVWIDTTNQVNLEGNEIHNIHGKPGISNGTSVAGVYIEKGNHRLIGNDIYDVEGGDGQSNLDPAGSGGSAYGIKIAEGESIISMNVISNVTGGNGGEGVQGYWGGNGSDSTNPNLPATDGEAGGKGGDAGHGGSATGIFINTDDGVLVDENEISNIIGGNAGFAGTGGVGGDGGDGAAGVNDWFGQPGGNGANGGLGGNGGKGGNGGEAFGFYLVAENIVCNNNLIQTVHGGNGTNGGKGGDGGAGGMGGSGGNGTSSFGGAGGAGGDGGNTGESGEAGQGGIGVGIKKWFGSISEFTRNRIEGIYGGFVWWQSDIDSSGGAGGDGGDGGIGFDISPGGAGGAGGNGGKGTAGSKGGDSGLAFGLWIENSYESFLITNSIITNVKAFIGGDGLDGCDGGDGGDGGQGGTNGEGDKAPTGAGGYGGEGGDGGYGGDSGDASLVRVIDGSADFVNNTLTYPLVSEIGGTGGEIGIGGLGGTGDPAGDNGPNGVYFMDGFPGYATGVMAIDSEVRVVNTILTGTSADWQCGLYTGGSGTIISNYNNLYGFLEPYYPTSIEGAHDFSADPLFVYAPSGDFHPLTGSPCIDAGDDVAIGAPEDDFDHIPRPLDGDEDGTAVIDVGAYEFGGYAFTVSVVVSPPGSGTGTIDPAKDTYHYGDVITLTAYAEPGWTFSRYDGFAPGNPLRIAVTGNMSFTAIFVEWEIKLYLPLILR